MTIYILTVDVFWNYTATKVQESHANSQFECTDAGMIPITDI